MHATAEQGKVSVLPARQYNQFWPARVMALFLQILHDGLGTVLDPQFLVNVLEMIVYRPGADLEPLGDFLVQRAPAEMVHDLMLTWGQVRKCILPRIAHQKIDLLLKIMPHPSRQRNGIQSQYTIGGRDVLI